VLAVVLTVSSYQFSEGVPKAAAVLYDEAGITCGGVFIDSAFVLTTASCSRSLSFGSGLVRVSPARSLNVSYEVSFGNPIQVPNTDSNRIAVIRLVCPGVPPKDYDNNGPVRFA